MASVLISVRLSPGLAGALDRATEYLDLSPSQLVGGLLQGGEPYHEEFLKVQVEGPFSEKRHLRLSPEAMHELRRLTRYRRVHAGEFVHSIKPSVLIRSMLAYFFSSPEAFQAVVPNAPRGEEWARLYEEDEAQIPRTSTFPRAAPPWGSWVGILLLLAILVLLLFEILDLVKQPKRREAPPPRTPSPSPPPRGGQGRLAGDEEDRPEQSSEEET